MNFFREIPGADKLFQWFDGAPSFHDAEVLELHFARSGKSWIRIMTVYKPATVTFSLEGIPDLELADFSCQNVISDLELDRRGGVFRLTMSPCYGIAGYVEAAGIAIDVIPRG
jgi:hypothetical protein